MIVTPWFQAVAGGTASLYLWITDTASRFAVEVDRIDALEMTIEPVWTAGTLRSVRQGSPVALDGFATGTVAWLNLTVPEPHPHARFRIETEGTVPFIWPGPGIVRSHFDTPQPFLRFSENPSLTLWADVPTGLDLMTLQAWIAPDSMPEAIAPNGDSVPVRWHIDRPAPYHVARIDTSGASGLWQFPLLDIQEPTRFTIFEGLPLFLVKPDRPFPYATIQTSIQAGASPIAGRIEVRQGAELLAVRDAFPGERSSFHLMPGPITLTASAGFHYRQTMRGITVAPESTSTEDFSLSEALIPESGWYAGDHHMHSFWEDGGQSPETVIRAARAQHLNYIFLTDLPEELATDDVFAFNEPGTFLALPGEEIMNRDAHCNALNTRSNTNLGGNDAYGDPLHDPSEWVANIAEQSATGVRASLMLNHPAHRPETASQRAYFRSWWIADKNPDIRLVENFDFISWFDRLNQGRHLTGLWTTDTHDIVFIPPGWRRTWVHVPGEFTEERLLQALEDGRCFNTRAPGALIYLTVNNAMPGETAAASDRHDISIRVESSRPIDRIDLISRGAIVASWQGNGAYTADIRDVLPVRGWVLAKLYSVEEPNTQINGHLGTPLDNDGCLAFTNPVWIESTPPERHV